MTRRDWLARIGALPLAAGLVPAILVRQGLGQFTEASPPCTDSRKATPASVGDPQPAGNAPLRTSVMEPGLSGTPLTLSGFVIGLRCGAIAGADLEFWQPDAHGILSSGTRLRGHQLTDAKGSFHLETIVPGAGSGRAPHLNVKVSAPNARPLVTQLFMTGDPANARDASFHRELALDTTRTHDGLKATFNVILDL